MDDLLKEFMAEPFMVSGAAMTAFCTQYEKVMLAMNGLLRRRYEATVRSASR